MKLPKRRRVLLLLLLLAAVALWAQQEWQERGASRLVAAIPVDVDVPLVQTEVFATGLQRITDLQFVEWPDGDKTRRILLVVQQPGEVIWLDMQTRERGQLLQTDVLSGGEMGLLGLADSPDFPRDPRMWTNAVVVANGQFEQAGFEKGESDKVESDKGESDKIEFDKKTEIRGWRLPATWQALKDGEQAEPLDVLLHFGQPYSNHNGGQLRFGPDRMLYIATGDGGAGGDPHGNGQNPATLLGKMLRIDPLHPGDERPYGIPADNPFVDNPLYRPEIFAIGLRNPWRFSFDAQGRLWTADVGQDRIEEVDIVPSGGNLGWKLREGHLCYETDSCQTAGLTDPVYAHDHSFGVSITGGFVYRGQQLAGLQGRYVFCDFGVPSIRALTKETMRGGVEREDGSPGRSESVGRHDGLCSTLGEDQDGELWLGDYSGRVLALVPHPQPAR